MEFTYLLRPLILVEFCGYVLGLYMPGSLHVSRLYSEKCEICGQLVDSITVGNTVEEELFVGFVCCEME